jgi:enamine deaminase RidA (YjgF/YER057c/UK114 family)
MSLSFDRRRFLARGGWLLGGAAAGLLAARRWPQAPGPAADARPAEGATPEARLRALKLELPAVGKPGATLVPAVRAGDLLFVSGHGPNAPGLKPVLGKVGADLDVKAGQAAARRVGLITLAVVRKELGSLDKVVRLVKVLGMVNATPGFQQHPQVINGFSDLMVEVFGEKAGTGARSAVGMASLPGGIPVEVEAIFQVRG